MSRKKTVLTLALGSAITAFLGVSAVVANDSPFAAQSLAKGYMVVAAGEVKSGDMKSDAKK